MFGGSTKSVSPKSLLTSSVISSLINHTQLLVEVSSMRYYFLTLSFLLGVMNLSAGTCKEDLVKFINEFESKVSPAYTKAATASFNAKISGKESDYEKSSMLQMELANIYSNKDDYKKLKAFSKCEDVKKDKDMSRQLKLMSNLYAGYQLDKNKLDEIIKLQTQIENKFSAFRATVNNKQLTDNQIENTLKNSLDSKELEASWLASKEIGPMVAGDVKKLVLMRNKAAKELGFKNYHQMMLKLNEQDPKEIESLFNELDKLTRPAYTKLKNEIDTALVKKYGIKKNELRPWHYQNRYFQEAPQIYDIDLDPYYKDANIEKLTKNYFNSIGMNIDSLIKNSDLYEKKGKYQHACCDNLDRKTDIRVICNITPSQRWMDTSLHEFGHAVYEKYLNQNMPWIYREPAHIFTTEAIAMLFGRMASNANWIQDMVGITAEEKKDIYQTSKKILRMEQLVFSRWSQVMYRFEKAMYENPDQDLNKLWWKLVEKYQLLKKPANRNMPDWSTKIHVALYPAYYHNYLMGALLASQLNHYITNNILEKNSGYDQSYVNRKDVGEYFINKVFYPGRSVDWKEMITKATGEKLTAKYYAKDFVK